MKKALSIIITVILLIAMVGALAETATETDNVAETEILFRGVEWCASYNDAVKGLPEGVTISRLDEGEYWGKARNDVCGNTVESGNYYKSKLGYWAYANSRQLEDVKVAGYGNVVRLDLKFVYVPDINGKIIRDTDHSAFILGKYQLEPADAGAVFEDLERKLTELYGEPAESREYGSVITTTLRLYRGANGSMVALYREKYHSGSDYIHICYGTELMDGLVEEAYAATVREEAENAATNYDGL